jgi:CyaY protein
MLTSPAATPLTDTEYDRLTQALLSRIEQVLDRWLQDDMVDIDGHRTGGMLELTLPAGSKVVVNTQPPLHELWLAARSGGRHFRFVRQQWLDTRDGAEFFSILSRELSAQSGLALTIEPA